LALQLPNVQWAYDDLLALPDDGKLYEIIEGDLFELPKPKLAHAVVVMNLILLVGPLVRSRGGVICTATIDVCFLGADPVKPDIVILLPGGVATESERGIEGPPDIVIEVLSPSNRTHDLLTKRALYQRGGVREYWIGDPDNQTLEVVSYADGRSVSRVFSGNQPVVSGLLPGVSFPTAAVFEGVDGGL
jgi:Uma2 family endonuclease